MTWSIPAILGWIAVTACFVWAGLCAGAVIDIRDQALAQTIEQGADEISDLNQTSHGEAL